MDGGRKDTWREGRDREGKGDKGRVIGEVGTKDRGR